jgi:hypothetical protein
MVRFVLYGEISCLPIATSPSSGLDLTVYPAPPI